MKELAALAYRDTTAENREFWKNEMAQCLREISNTYDEKLEIMRGELETYYNLKVSDADVFYPGPRLSNSSIDFFTATKMVYLDS